MKLILFTILYLLFMVNLNAQVMVAGNYTTLNNDTVQGKLKLASYFNAINWEKIQRKIKYADTLTNKDKKCKPADINGYCFYWKNEFYCYKSLLTITSHPVFSQQITSGKRASLFYSFKKGYRGRITSFYYVQKSTGETINLKNASRKRVKDLLPAFFAEDPAAQNTINTFNFARKFSLKTLVDSINNQ